MWSEGGNRKTHLVHILCVGFALFLPKLLIEIETTSQTHAWWWSRVQTCNAHAFFWCITENNKKSVNNKNTSVILPSELPLILHPLRHKTQPRKPNSKETSEHQKMNNQCGFSLSYQEFSLRCCMLISGCRCCATVREQSVHSGTCFTFDLNIVQARSRVYLLKMFNSRHTVTATGTQMRCETQKASSCCV